LKVVPCNVAVKRFYRAYATVSDDATDEQIIEAVKKEIVESQEAALCDADDLEIEYHDIVNVEIDHDAAWGEII